VTLKIQIPDSWSHPAIEELTTFVIGGDWGKAPEFDDPNFDSALCIRGSEFRNWSEDKGKTASVRKLKVSSINTRVLKEGDILVEISGGGPGQPVGRTVLIDKSVLSFNPELPKVCTNFLRLVRLNENSFPTFVNYFLNYFYVSGEVINYQSGSNNLRNLKFNDYIGIGIPFPPLNEQHRIVAKIEELFSELEKGVESLKAAREQLKVYRQSVLKAAFEGRLTESWRKELADELESASELLARIKTEREARYEARLAEWQQAVNAWEAEGGKASGTKKPTKPKMPKELPPLTADELADLPALPKGWGWIKLGEGIEEPAYGTSKKCDYESDGIGVLRIPNIANGFIDDSDLKFATFDEREVAQYKLCAGDLLTIRSNGSVSLVGKCALIRDKDEKFLYAGYLIRIRPLRGIFKGSFLYYVLSSSALRSQIEFKAKSTSGVNNINSNELKALVLPACSLGEQHQIVQEIESRFSVVEKMEQTIEESLQKAEALRQSILKRAFEGKLVPQNPDDEPASELLARIRAEREAASHIPKRGRKKV